MPEMSARRKDYTQAAQATARRPLPADLEIGPCRSTEPLAEVRGALKRLKHDAAFMAKIFETRCKQLYPRDLLVATVPTKKGGRRPAGILRRSQRFDKEAGCACLSVDFVWVLPEFRACGLGRQLMGAGLVSGKPKDVRLQVAGSEANTAAVGLYTSLGFSWAEDAPPKTEMLLTAEGAAAAVEAIARAAARQGAPIPTLPPTPPTMAARAVSASVRAQPDGSVRVRLAAEAAAPLTVLGPPGAVAARAKASASSAQDRAVRLSAG